MADRDIWAPWYWQKDYKGNLSEEEKGILDSFRLNDKHPATAYHDLPEEVQNYVSHIEQELYDKKQDSAVDKAFILESFRFSWKRILHF